MNEHDDICVCFHVSVHKLRKYVRLNKPKLPTQLAECYGAGTGCGWCIPFLQKIFEAESRGEQPDLHLTREEYIELRNAYRTGMNLPPPIHHACNQVPSPNEKEGNKNGC
jgi:bacterioferritin-associated ferredoxin